MKRKNMSDMISGMKKKIIFLSGGILILILILCVLVRLCIILDYRKVRLEYVGRVTINPPLTKFMGNDVAYFIQRGKTLRQELEKRLFPVCYEFPDEEHDLYEIGWDENLRLDDNALCYVGLGCEIEEITYYYHTKYTTSFRGFVIHSISLSPLRDRSIITIYKADVSVSE